MTNFLCVKMQIAQSCPTLCDPMNYPWNSTGQNIGVGNNSLLQEIFPNLESNLGLLHCRPILYELSYKESPLCVVFVGNNFKKWLLLPFLAFTSFSPLFNSNPKGNKIIFN